MRRSVRRSRYSQRKRETDFMLWVKMQACCASTFAIDLGSCDGVVEADHAGLRGMGMKASDWTCVPICTLHHRQRTDFSGPFKKWTQEMMRSFLQSAVANTQLLARLHGFEIPSTS
jgi:hypothetical protein